MRAARGFTLIEVLVALAIVVIGMAALLGTMGSAADTTAYLRDKTFAQWIALNEVAVVRLSAQLPPQGKTEGDLDYAGRRWHWQQVVTPLELPGIERIDVNVQLGDTPAGKKAPWLATVTGAVGDAVAPPQLTSLYQEYTATPGPGNGPGTMPVPRTGGLGQSGGTVPPPGLSPPSQPVNGNGPPQTQSLGRGGE